MPQVKQMACQILPSISQYISTASQQVKKYRWKQSTQCKHIATTGDPAFNFCNVPYLPGAVRVQFEDFAQETQQSVKSNRLSSSNGNDSSCDKSHLMMSCHHVMYESCHIICSHTKQTTLKCNRFMASILDEYGSCVTSSWTVSMFAYLRPLQTLSHRTSATVAEAVRGTKVCTPAATVIQKRNSWSW